MWVHEEIQISLWRMKRYHQVQVFNQGMESYIDASTCWVAVKQKQKQKQKPKLGAGKFMRVWSVCIAHGIVI